MTNPMVFMALCRGSLLFGVILFAGCGKATVSDSEDRVPSPHGLTLLEDAEFPTSDVVHEGDPQAARRGGVASGSRQEPPASGNNEIAGHSDGIPDEDAVRQWLTAFLEEKFPVDDAHQGAFYAWSDSVAYRFHGNPQPQLEIAIEEIAVAPDEQTFIRAAFRLRVHAAGWMVSSMPVRFNKKEFPALLPWSNENPMPVAEYTMQYLTGREISFHDVNLSLLRQPHMRLARDYDPGQPVLWGDVAGCWLASLRPFGQAERIWLLNLDQTPILSPEGQSKYVTLKEAFPRMVLQMEDSYLVLHEDLLDSTTNFRLDTELEAYLSHDNGSGDLISDLTCIGGYAINGSYLVTELRGGGHQLWMEEHPLNEIDPLNGVSFRGTAYIAVRGLVRGKYLVVRKAYMDRQLPRLEVGGPWSDWINAETRIGEFSVMVKNGTTYWRNRNEDLASHLRDTTKLSLEDWCASDNLAEIIKATIVKEYLAPAPLRIPRR